MRKDIVIEVLTQEIDETRFWETLDTFKDQEMTFQFISNILTGIDSITSSSTLSVKIPRTVKNERVMDFATRPQYESTMTHRKIECHISVNGIDMTGDKAYCYLLDSESDSYDICIVFGLLQNYSEWIDAKKSIKDLEDSLQSIPWNWRAAFYDIAVPVGSPHDTDQYPPIWYGDDPNINTYTPQNGIGKLMHYGIYTPGFNRTDTLVDYANVHPFVTVREIFERIKSENGLNFVFPTNILRDMENLAIVLTDVGGNNAQGSPSTDNNTATMGDSPDTVRLSSSLSFGWNIICSTTGDCYRNGSNSVKGKILKQGDANAVDLNIMIILNDGSSFQYNGVNRSAGFILNAVNHMEYLNLCVYIYATRQTVTLTPTFVNDHIIWQGTVHIPCLDAEKGDAVADIWIDNDARICRYLDGAFERYWMTGRSNWDGLFEWLSCSIGVVFYTGSLIYPHPSYRCFQNLPDINQLDFIKFICQIYCLFPVVTSFNSEQVEFVPFGIIEENIPKAYDWSDKLLEKSKDVPERMAYRYEEMARKNIIEYKADDKDPVYDDIRKGYIEVDDETLDNERNMVTFPLAAVENDTINQYIITREESDNDPPVITYKADFIRCEHRLMRVTEWIDPIHKKVTRLGFVNLTVPYIISTYYAEYQTSVRNPKLITEHIRLNELEMRDVDFKTPVYLRKYGRYYAIRQIQWTVGDDYAEVELIQL